MLAAAASSRRAFNSTSRTGDTDVLLAGHPTVAPLLRNRFKLIRALNLSLVSCLDQIALGGAALVEGSLAHSVASRRRYILSAIKEPIITGALEKSQSSSSGSSCKLQLSRFSIPRHLARGEVDEEGRWTTFGQVRVCLLYICMFVYLYIFMLYTCNKFVRLYV